DRWIRTTVGIHQQIYSLPHLAALVYPLHFVSAKRFAEIVRKSTSFFDFCKALAKKNVIFFYYSLIPKLNAVN
ncbi:MAG: hypothetical protein RL638_2120, partial [Bacteroidota bacterium]